MSALLWAASLLSTVYQQPLVRLRSPIAGWFDLGTAYSDEDALVAA